MHTIVKGLSGGANQLVFSSAHDVAQGHPCYVAGGKDPLQSIVEPRFLWFAKSLLTKREYTLYFGGILFAGFECWQRDYPGCQLCSVIKWWNTAKPIGRAYADTSTDLMQLKKTTANRCIKVQQDTSYIVSDVFWSESAAVFRTKLFSSIWKVILFMRSRNLHILSHIDTICRNECDALQIDAAR